MARKTIDITRRQVLYGLGGATLALPVLPSLLGRSAYGADPTFTRAPRLMWFATDHGGAYESNMFPAPSMLTDKKDIFPGHTASFGKLVASSTGDQRGVSPILTANKSVFSDQLLSKMNVLWGLDVPFYIAHNTGLHMGNYARNDGGDDGLVVQKSPRPTIDQLLAWSPSFYPDLSAVKQRSLSFGNQQISWGYSSPASLSGDIAYIKGTNNSQQLFDQIFVPPPSEGTTNRSPVVDRVLDSYKSLRNGNSRLSAADKQRLDDHIERINELQRRAHAVSSCGNVDRPSEDSAKYANMATFADTVKYYQLLIDVAVVAFMCGSSRIASMGLLSANQLVEYAGDWHQDVAHQWPAAGQPHLVQTYQRVFENVVLHAAASLDVEEAPGMTYLDNTLIAWSQESGMESHTSTSIPIVTFGSAAGFFKTGVFADYRRVANKASYYKNAGPEDIYLGVLYNQWLANVLLSMGLKREDFELWGHTGYGVPFLTVVRGWGPPYIPHYESLDSKYFKAASDPLPFIT